MIQMIVAALVAIVIAAGGGYFKGREDGARKSASELAEFKAGVEVQRLNEEKRNARIEQAAEAAGVAAGVTVRDADARAAASEAHARDSVVRLNRALRDLADVRRVLDGARRGAAPEPAPAAAGTDGEGPRANLARRPAACEEALAVTVETMAVNNANHDRCLARLTGWQAFYETLRKEWNDEQGR